MNSGPPDGDGHRRRHQAQAIILAGFILAVGIVASVVILNSTVESINLQSAGEGDVSSAPVNYRQTMESEGREAINIVNSLAVRQAMHWTDANSTYVDYMDALNFQMQRELGSSAAVEIENFRVNASFNNSWRMRKNQSTPFQRVVRKPVDVVYAIDSSGSMGSNDGSGLRYDAAKDMTANLSRFDRVAMVDWDHDAGYKNGGIVLGFQNASGDGQARLNASADALASDGDSYDGSTYIGGGIREAIDLFREDGESSHANVVVLLTDGANQNGWFHFPSKYAFSHTDTNDDGGGDTYQTLHEWGFVADFGSDDSDVASTRAVASSGGTTTYDGLKSTLDARTIHQATREDNQSITIYSVLLGDDTDYPADDTDWPHVQEIANVTGGKYYNTTDASGLNSIFSQITQDIAEPKSLASNVSRFDRFRITVDDFSEARNLTVQLRDQDDDLLWRLNASNKSGRRVISVDDGSDTLNVHDWTDPAIGGPPIQIDVLDDTIDGADRNLSKHLFDSEDNVSVVFQDGQGVNGTYDIWTDTGADVEGQCGVPPCASPTNQTVGAIRETNFTVRYDSDSVSFTDSFEIQTTAEQETQTPAPTGPPAPPSDPPGTAGVLEFAPPTHDMETYWAFDQTCGGGPTGEHAFDATGHNHTAGLTPDAPDVDLSTSVSCGSFNFSRSAGVIDEDGWNDIPLEGPFTLSFWIKPGGDTAPNDYGGTIFDATKNLGDDVEFEITYRDRGTSIADDEIGWHYEDADGFDGDDVNLSVRVGDEVREGDWINVIAVGGWNQSFHGLFTREADCGESYADFDPCIHKAEVLESDFGEKPMQQPTGDATFEGISVGAPLVSNGADPGFPDFGFIGHVDDVRLYHHRLADVERIQNRWNDGFHAIDQKDKFQNWSASSKAGKSNDTFNEDPWSGFTCCQDGSSLTMDSGSADVPIDLGGAVSADLSVWVRAGSSSFGTDEPDDWECNNYHWLWGCTDWSPPDDLELQYLNSLGTWNTLRTFSGASFTGGQTEQFSTSLPPDAFHNGFRLRFVQTSGDGNNEDYWHVDNVELTWQSVPTGNYEVRDIDQVYNDVNATDIPHPVTSEEPTATDERTRFFVTPYRSYGDDVDVQNFHLTNVRAANSTGDLRVRVESNISTNGLDPNTVPENVSGWIDIRSGKTSYDVPPEPGDNAVNLTVPNDEFRLRVEATSPKANSSTRFLEANLRAP